MQAEIDLLEKRLSEEGIWEKPQEAHKLNKKYEELREELSQFKHVESRLEALRGILGLLNETPDDAMAKECESEIRAVMDEIDGLEIKYFLRGEYDHLGGIMSIHPGAGGTEAQDWAQMLLRMYTRWAERNGFKVQVIDYAPGEEAGLKSATIMIEGRYAYGLLHAEKGVHRLVRISPFDANKRRHTSFASVDVVPRIDSDIKIDIRDDDLKIDTYRSSGAGGQLVNKISSAVRITHVPSGIVVQCQNERSQHQNRATAMAILKAKLFELAREKQEAELDRLRGEQRDIAFGSQIRSYVFQPYTQIKDLRTDYEIHDIQSVMDGNIDPFIKAFLKKQAIDRAKSRNHK